MGNVNNDTYQPSCMLAHDLINRLAVIVGYCDLLAQESPDDSKGSKRLRIMRDIANSAAEELNKHQCRLDALTRIGATQNRSLSKRP